MILLSVLSKYLDMCWVILFSNISEKQGAPSQTYPLGLVARLGLFESWEVFSLGCLQINMIFKPHFPVNPSTFKILVYSYL